MGEAQATLALHLGLVIIEWDDMMLAVTDIMDGGHNLYLDSGLASTCPTPFPGSLIVLCRTIHQNRDGAGRTGRPKDATVSSLRKIPKCRHR